VGTAIADASPDRFVQGARWPALKGEPMGKITNIALTPHVFACPHSLLFQREDAQRSEYAGEKTL
jgi:hypothetical protein